VQNRYTKNRPYCSPIVVRQNRGILNLIHIGSDFDEEKRVERIKNILLYGSLNKEAYDNIRPSICEENRKSVDLFAILAIIAFLLTGVLSLVNKDGAPAVIYFCGVFIFLLILIINLTVTNNYPKVSDALALLFSAIVLALGIVIAYSQIGERTTMLLPLFLIVALVFCYRPVYLVAMLIVSEIAYLIVIGDAQEPGLFFINKVNTCIFCFMGIVSGLLMLITKHKKYYVEYQNTILLEKDILTGLYNRFSYDKALDKILEKKVPVTICSMDVNDLKLTNDTKGHLAGDELIKGAADCINQVFSKYGNVYRTGGDEFCALLFQDVDEEKIRREFMEKTKSWKGDLVDGLSIALGMARLDHDFEGRLTDVIHEADAKMYEEKKARYKG